MLACFEACKHGSESEERDFKRASVAQSVRSVEQGVKSVEQGMKSMTESMHWHALSLHGKNIIYMAIYILIHHYFYVLGAAS